MNAPIIAVAATTEIITKFGLTEDQIEAMRAECATVDWSSPKSYATSSKVLAKVRDTRTGIEKRRKELERQAEIKRRLDALRPDAEKIQEYADRVSHVVLSGPELETVQANEFMRGTVSELLSIVLRMRDFGK